MDSSEKLRKLQSTPPQPPPSAHTRRITTAKQEQSKKSSESKLLESCRAALDVLRSVDRGAAGHLIPSPLTCPCCPTNQPKDYPWRSLCSVYLRLCNRRFGDGGLSDMQGLSYKKTCVRCLQHTHTGTCHIWTAGFPGAKQGVSHTGSAAGWATRHSWKNKQRRNGWMFHIMHMPYFRQDVHFEVAPNPS